MYIEDDNFMSKLEETALSCCAPLYVQDHYLMTGHNSKTANGTATFVKFEGRHYVCTCDHVVEAAKDPAVVGEAIHGTTALMSGKMVFNLSFFTADGLQSSFHRPDMKLYELDLQIAPIDAHWPIYSQKASKVAIDLDNWKEPPWSNITMCCAAGYPEIYKREVGDTIKGHFLRILADLSSKLSPDQREFKLESEIPGDRWFLSGMSGGPIFAIGIGGELYPVGIAFKGYPADPWSHRSSTQDSDIKIHGLVLTPDRFSEWLQRTPLGRSPQQPPSAG